MSTEFWAIVAVGLANAGLVLKAAANTSGRLTAIETRLGALEQSVAALKGQMDMLLRGLHISVSGNDPRRR